LTPTRFIRAWARTARGVLIPRTPMPLNCPEQGHSARRIGVRAFAAPRCALSTLILAEHSAGALNDATLSTIAASAKLGGETHVLVVGHKIDAVATSCAAVAGVARVFTVDTGSDKPAVSEVVAAAVIAAHKAGGYSHLLAPSTSVGKSVMPRVAALLDVAAITDVIGVDSADTFVRPIYAGESRRGKSRASCCSALRCLSARCVVARGSVPQRRSGAYPHSAMCRDELS
jgi:electron transfer flavoprotein alpha subunit